MQFYFLLPLADIKFLTPPPGNSGAMDAVSNLPALSPTILWVAMAVVALVGLWVTGRALLLLLRRKITVPKRWIVVDGSNVMHWKDETPQIASVRAVVRLLQHRGLTPGVVFDANAGYKLAGRHMNDKALARLLGLPVDQVLVVPSGTPADLFILAAARDHGARVVSRDRFRDWAADYPEVRDPGFLIRGGFSNGGEFWLEEGVQKAGRAAR